jgi:hypothetical protein
MGSGRSIRSQSNELIRDAGERAVEALKKPKGRNPARVTASTI